MNASLAAPAEHDGAAQQLIRASSRRAQHPLVAPMARNGRRTT
jgi:hypothetical protein